MGLGLGFDLDFDLDDSVCLIKGLIWSSLSEELEEWVYRPTLLELLIWILNNLIVFMIIGKGLLKFGAIVHIKINEHYN